MRGREFASGEIDFQPITSASRGRENGVRISLLHLPAPVEIDVFPHRLIVARKHAFRHEVVGPTSYRWGGRKLLVDARSVDGTARLVATHEGQVVFLHQQTEPVTSKLIQTASNGEIHHTDLTLTEKYTPIDVNRPETFEQMSFGDIVKFFRTEYDLTQAEFAERAEMSRPSILRIESTEGQTTRTYSFMEYALDWQSDDPRREIFRQAWKRSRVRKS